MNRFAGGAVQTPLRRLEVQLVELAQRINAEPQAGELTDRYLDLVREFAATEPVDLGDIAAVLRTFLREVEGNDYHGTERLQDLIRQALTAAETLAATRFDAALDHVDAIAMLPAVPDNDMVRAGARAGKVSGGVVRAIYQAMANVVMARRTR